MINKHKVCECIGCNKKTILFDKMFCPLHRKAWIIYCAHTGLDKDRIPERIVNEYYNRFVNKRLGKYY